MDVLWGHSSTCHIAFWIFLPILFYIQFYHLSLIFFMAPLPKEIVTLHEVRLFLLFILVDLTPPAGSDHGKAQ